MGVGDLEDLLLRHPGRIHADALRQRGGQDERLHRRARLTAPLGGQVEGGGLVVLPADHRPDLTGLVVDHDHRCGGALGVAQVVLDRLLGRLLQVEVDGGLHLQPALERLARAVLVDELLADPGGEVRRLGGDRRRPHLVSGGHGHAHGVAVVHRPQMALLQHLIEHDIAPVQRRLGVRDRVVAARALDDAGQHRRLGRIERLGAGHHRALDLLATAGVVPPEVGARGALDAVRAVAVVDRVEVLGEDLVLGPLAREVVGQRRLAELLEDGALGLRLHRVLDELLGDRRAALRRALLDHVLEERAPHRLEVDAGVLVEALVLDGDHRELHDRRNLLGVDQDPMLVVGQHADRASVHVGHVGVLGLLVLLAVLQGGQVGGDRHHHPEEG